MTAQTLQRVVVRLSTYLTESGVTMNRSMSRKLLKMLDDALAETGGEGETDDFSEAQLLARAMDRLPDYFPVVEETIPAPAPPLLRGSIGYPAHG
ncbi:hypothetical protein A8B84_16560 [Marinobacter sp. EhC06]|jgi:hypothetical protein|uniref:hypothetical protein n=1 Tax=Marinobacter TaxID=2742 RepID=UPI0007D9BB96|nr:MULTISPECIES: hypothetical protein [unclassified Marinobacter]OAN92157.1 hypothetical protein A8B80_19620 [Marinobacter sp. EhN04]OAN96569.1 hypothetical protein A8B84_16560 [Marinobacter sp. EhC06]